MKNLLILRRMFILGLLIISNYAFSQSLLGTWDKVSGPGDPIRYNFLSDSTVVIHFPTTIDSAEYVTLPIPSSELREIDLGQNGVVGWRGIYLISIDNSTLQIEGYWYTGLPLIDPPTFFTTPTSYIRVISEAEEYEISHNLLRLQNYPNPFNPTTTIRFDIKDNESGTLTIFNLKGQIILSEQFEAGHYNYLWNGDTCSSGLYFYRLKTDSDVIIRKMVMMK